ncbi:MAG: ribbon-helix-helix protein, CopG family [Candidatus Undinarchaeales archaeon]|jgi:RHH-type rel operon transcriptional repressor/antitoxin RelB|nr:ribbon-helix-helix protein, CopG family [Candidatus Undinarchaeales archaeon]MDP7492600.1 ribbon-helix-helix protein, CopG family [Candidatus Undinarchaeales archaeon]
MTTTVSIRLPDEIVEELDSMASSLERSKTFIIRKAIESYLQEYVDYLIALDRLRDKDDEIISSDEMRERLGL